MCISMDLNMSHSVHCMCYDCRGLQNRSGFIHHETVNMTDGAQRAASYITNGKLSTK